MSYTPSTDFLALITQGKTGARMASMPGLDYVVAALARAGLITLWTDPGTAPPAGRTDLVWLKVSSSSWATEATVFLWDDDTGAYKPATPALWARLTRLLTSISKQLNPSASMTLGPQHAQRLITNAALDYVQFTLPLASSVAGYEYEFLSVQPGSLNVLVYGSGKSNADALYWGANLATVGAQAIYRGSYMKIRSVNGSWFVTGSGGTWTLS